MDHFAWLVGAEVWQAVDDKGFMEEVCFVCLFFLCWMQGYVMALYTDQTVSGRYLVWCSMAF